jgi:CBS domain-containing protein
MARYGRDFDQDRWGGGYGPGGGGDRGGFRGGEYGGMGSDGYGGFGGAQYGRGARGFGPGGGGYDQEFESGGGGRGRGYGADYGGMAGSGGVGGGYGAGGYGGGMERGGYGGGAEMDWNRGSGQGGWGGGMGQDDWGPRREDELNRLRARDVMTDDPETVTPDATLADAARKMRDLDVGIIPVVESDGNRRLKGVITDRDIAVRAVAEGDEDVRQTKVSQCMTTQVETCNKNDTLRDVLRVMKREQVRRVPITDREGRLVGIIAQADVLTDVQDHAGSHRVMHAVERISQPAEPRRSGRASQSRGGED